MLPVKETKHVETARDLLIGQFKKRRVIQGFLDTYVRRIQDVEDALWQLIDARILDTATNAQLESLGKLAGEERLNRTDALFRAAIRLRIRVNRSKGRITDIIDVAMLAAGVDLPTVIEYQFLAFEVDLYNQIGERYVAELLSKTRAATSYGLFVASDLPLGSLLEFDDAVVPGAGIETFSDAVSGTGKLCASGYGLPTDFSGVVLSGGVPSLVSLNKSGLTRTQGGILFTLTGTGFTGATGVTFGGTAATSVTVVNPTTITCVTPAKAAGTHAVVVTGPGGSSSGSVTCKFVDPTSIFGANLKRWYSATYAAGAWTDVTGAFNASQSTAGKRPTATSFAGTADRPGTHFALSFDGVDDGLDAGGASDIVTTAATMACVVQPAASQNTEANIIAKNFGNNAYIFGIRSADPGKAYFGCGGSTGTEGAISAAAINTNTVHRLIGTYGSTTSTLYKNGTLEADTGTGTLTTGTTDFNAIGCAMITSDATTAFYYTGLVGEVVMANVVANSTQRSELDAYLRDCAGQAS